MQYVWPPGCPNIAASACSSHRTSGATSESGSATRPYERANSSCVVVVLIFGGSIVEGCRHPHLVQLPPAHRRTGQLIVSKASCSHEFIAQPKSKELVDVRGALCVVAVVCRFSSIIAQGASPWLTGCVCHRSTPAIGMHCPVELDRCPGSQIASCVIILRAVLPQGSSEHACRAWRRTAATGWEDKGEPYVRSRQSSWDRWKSWGIPLWMRCQGR